MQPIEVIQVHAPQLDQAIAKFKEEVVRRFSPSEHYILKNAVVLPMIAQPAPGAVIPIHGQAQPQMMIAIMGFFQQESDPLQILKDGLKEGMKAVGVYPDRENCVHQFEDGICIHCDMPINEL